MLLTDSVVTMPAYFVISLFVVTVSVPAAANLRPARQGEAEPPRDGVCAEGGVACHGLSASGPCIPLVWLCDQIVDCTDNWDETPSVCDAYEHLAANDSEYCTSVIWRHCRSFLDPYMPSPNVTSATAFSNVASESATNLCNHMDGFRVCVEETKSRICPSISEEEMPNIRYVMQFVGMIVQYACDQHYEEFSKAHHCTTSHLDNGLNLFETFLKQCEHVLQSQPPATPAPGICRAKPLHDCAIGVAERYCGQEVARFAKDFQEYFFECSLGD